jgi:hypothetical protein
LQQGKLVKQDNIDEIINSYNPRAKNDKPSCWKGTAGDTNLKLYTAEINQEGENAKLTITYEIFSPAMGYVFSVQFFNIYGTQLCVSSASDFASDAEYKVLCTQGRHTITLFFDTSLFANGEYYVDFDFTIPNIKRVISPDIKLYFDIQNSTRKQRHPAGSRENVVAPNWNWDIS